MISAGALREKSRRLWKAQAEGEKGGIPTRPGEKLLAEVPVGFSTVLVVIFKPAAGQHRYGLLLIRLWRLGPDGARAPASAIITLRTDCLPLFAEAIATAMDFEVDRSLDALPTWAAIEGDER